MKKKLVNIFDYSKIINEAYNPGILLTTRANDKVNSMVIGWGTLGVIFNEKTFIVYVRNNRYTHELLDINPEFTINVPLDSKLDSNIIKICGTKSGRNLNKIKEANLTLVEPNSISVPGILEAPLTIECKVIYKIDQVTLNLPDDVRSRFYNQNQEDTYHTVYYGKIVSSYIIEE